MSAAAAWALRGTHAGDVAHLEVTYGLDLKARYRWTVEPTPAGSYGTADAAREGARRILRKRPELGPLEVVEAHGITTTAASAQ